MLWITLTRYGARRTIRVNAAAIAFTDRCQGGAVLSFGGGETLRVSETPEEVEGLIAAGAPPPDLELAQEPASEGAGDQGGPPAGALEPLAEPPAATPQSPQGGRRR